MPYPTPRATHQSEVILLQSCRCTIALQLQRKQFWTYIDRAICDTGSRSFVLVKEESCAEDRPCIQTAGWNEESTRI